MIHRLLHLLLMLSFLHTSRSFLPLPARRQALRLFSDWSIAGDRDSGNSRSSSDRDPNSTPKSDTARDLSTPAARKSHFGKLGKKMGSGGSSGSGYSSGGSQSSRAGFSDRSSYSKPQHARKPPTNATPPPAAAPSATMRVFVQNLPTSYTWVELKDLFRGLAGGSLGVAFASVSKNRDTGLSKGVGIVQFETRAAAVKVCKMGMDGDVVALDETGKEFRLYVREDAQERRGGLGPGMGTPRPDRNRAIGGEKVLVKYTCGTADHDMSDDEVDAVESLVSARLDARFRRNYEAADQIREQLLEQYKVRIDDRAKVWYLDSGTKSNAHTIWSRAKGFKEDQTGLVDEEELTRLLQRRDAARLRRDFASADDILKEVYACVIDEDGEGWKVVVDDDKKKWKLWRDDYVSNGNIKNVRDVEEHDNGNKPAAETTFLRNTPSSSSALLTTVDECLNIVRENGGGEEKVTEVEELLLMNMGKEEEVLAKLRARYGEASEAASDEASVEAAFTDELLRAKTVPELKVELKKRGLLAGGRKDELIARLLE